jgi:hypothetical protein
MYSKIKDGDQRKKEKNNPYPVHQYSTHSTPIRAYLIDVQLTDSEELINTLMSLLLEPCFSSENTGREKKDLESGKAGFLHICLRVEQFEQKGYQHIVASLTVFSRLH